MRMKIRPDKHFNIETSIISLGNVIIKELITNNCIKFTKLFFLLRDFYKDATLDEFIYSLTFLYSMGIVEYSKDDDSIKLIMNNQEYESIEMFFPYLEYCCSMIKVGDSNAN